MEAVEFQTGIMNGCGCERTKSVILFTITFFIQIYTDTSFCWDVKWAVAMEIDSIVAVFLCLWINCCIVINKK